jgi:hypothetical protein
MDLMGKSVSSVRQRGPTKANLDPLSKYLSNTSPVRKFGGLPTAKNNWNSTSRFPDSWFNTSVFNKTQSSNISGISNILRHSAMGFNSKPTDEKCICRIRREMCGQHRIGENMRDKIKERMTSHCTAAVNRYYIHRPLREEASSGKKVS